MTDVEQSLIDFHRSFGAFYQTSPALPPEETKALRLRLLKEEFKELIDEIEANNLEGIAVEGVDLVYVVVGALVTYGIPFNVVFDAIHEANMNKLVDCPTCAVEYYEGSWWYEQGEPESHMISEGCEKCRYSGKISLKDAGGKMLKPPGWQKADVGKIIREATNKELDNAMD